MDCVYTINVPSNSRLLLRLKRFSLEPEISDNCVDYLDIHDGDGLTSPTLNGEPLCGIQIPEDYVTSGSAVTFHFVTDDSAVYRGFEIVYSAFTNGELNSN